MSSVYYKIGQLFKAKEAEMVNGRVTQVNTDTSNKDSAVTSITNDKNTKFSTLDSDIAAAKTAKEALLASKKAELSTAIAALLTNATAEVDSITDLINYLNANNSDWTTTLNQKQTDLTAALDAQKLSIGDFGGFEAIWGVIYTRSTAAVPSTDLTLHININEDPQKADGSFPADGESVMAFGGDASSATNNGSPIRYNSVYQWGAGGNTVEISNPFLDFTSNKVLTPNGLDFSSEEATVIFAMVEGRYDETDSHQLRFTDANQKGIQFLFDKSGHASKIKVFFKLNAANTKYGFISDDYVITDNAMHTILATADGAGNLTVKVDGTEIDMSSIAVPNLGWTPHINGHFHLGDLAAYNGILSGNDLASLEAYFDFKYTNLPSMEAMFQDLSKNYAGGFYGPSPIDSDYIDGQISNVETYAYPEKYFKLGTRAEMTVSYAGVHPSNYHQYMILPKSKWKWAAQARSYDYVPAYQVRYSSGKAYGVYHRNYGQGATYAVEMGDDNFTYLNNPGAPIGKMNPGDTVGFIVEWDGTMKLTQNGAVIFTFPDKLTEDFVFAPLGVFGDWKVDMSGHMVDFDAIADIYGERFEGAELVTPTLVETSNVGMVVSLGGINANQASVAGKNGKATLGSIQGAGSYIEFVGAQWPQGPNHEFTIAIDTDSSNFDITASPYAVKRYNAHGTQFYKDGAFVEGNIHFCSRPFFGEWTNYHPAEYWETHGDDDTVENKTVGPCRIQLMEGNKLVWFVNDYPVWEQADFDVTQKWYFNLNFYKYHSGCSLENIKIKSVQ